MGRRAEREVVDQLLASARAGRSRVLVVRGEAGIGKSALLEHARGAGTASGFRVQAVVGVEAETQFAFSGLHQLCDALEVHAGALPERQQAALGVAFGRRSGPPPDRFLVGLATLDLLAEAAEESPLLCLVDDAQWLDEASAQVLAFVARRVAAERLALVFGLRDPSDGDLLPFVDLPDLLLHGLADTEARALLADEVAAPLDEEVRERIVAEARGNPLALLELPRGVQPAQLAGGFELPSAVGVPRRIETFYERRSGSLPADAQLLSLVAAAEPTGDVALLRRAAGLLGVDPAAAAPAEAAGLLEIDTRVRFRHPLVRSAVYRAATPPDRRRAHGALAEATDPAAEPDRRAWHRAQAVPGTDEEVAAELERSAARARARGGLAAAAAFLRRAVELTPDPAVRAPRALDAAQTTHESGASASALEQLAIAAGAPADALSRSRIQLLQAQIAFHLTQGSDVPDMLLQAARTLAPLDPALSRETYLQALDAATIIGGGRVPAVAAAAREAPAPPGPPRPADLLLDGRATAFTQSYEAAVPDLRRAVDAFRTDAPPTTSPGDGRWLWLASRTAAGLFDDDLAYRLAERNVGLAREAGALAALPGALVFLASALVLTGEHSRATELSAEGDAITRAIGAAPLVYARLILAAWRGDRAETEELCSPIVATSGGRDDGNELSYAQYAMSVLCNGLGDYPAAADAAARSCAAYDLTHANLALPELVEAASRAGQPDRAAAALEHLSARARASGTPWARGLEARSRALTSTGTNAEDDYREAIDRLGNCRIATHLARTHLVYGEWLRREGRRQDARGQLRTAHEMLSQMGAEAFAARAARELRATGEHPRRRSGRPTDVLTAQEQHIARLVATGFTSREVGAQLFLSPRTIETHLRTIFRKLGITSRRQLREMRLP